MEWLNELGVALKTAGRVAGQGRFWAAMGRALFSSGLLLVFAVLAAVYVSVDAGSLLSGGLGPSNIALGLVAIACSLLVGPLLMRAWCPVAARAVVDTMQLALPELPLPSLGRFIGAWLLVMVMGLLLLVAAFFIPKPFSWIMLLPAALVFGGYQVRCALCIHAGTADRQAVVQGTWVRRTLAWFPLCALPLYLYEMGEAALKGLFISPYDFAPSLTSKLVSVLGAAGSLAVFALVLVLWAALSLQAFTARRGFAALGARPVPAAPAVPRPRSAPVRSVPQRAPATGKWILVTLGVVLCVSGIAYLARLPLLHQYLAWSDPDYQQEVRNRPGLSTGEKLGMAFSEAACAGKLPRMKLLLRAGLAPAPEMLGTALASAARCGQIDAARFLIRKKANVNAMPAHLNAKMGWPVTPLQFAVSGNDVAMVALLLGSGADASLQSPEAGSLGPLHFAARNADLAMMEMLVKAGARPDAPAPQAPIFYFVEASGKLADPSAAGWAVVIARAERAGLSTSGRDAEGGNLLHWAASRGQCGLIEVLLGRGLDRHQQEKRGAMPFMHLANWYRYTTDEPGPELEFVLKALTSGVRDINVAADLTTRRSRSTSSLETGWTLARAAAAKRRVRLVFGERIDYSMLGGQVTDQQWPLQDKEQAALLIGDLSPEQLAAAPALAGALQAKGWADLLK